MQKNQSGRHFKELLEAQQSKGKFLCLGLDTDYEKIPETARISGVQESIVAFNRAIIDATKDMVGAYKPNSAFYEAYGDEGLSALRETIRYSLDQAPDVPVILDAKRADIGNTNEGYVSAAFEYLQADAVTLQPYLGKDALEPFLKRSEKGIFILCRTSNPGSGEFQNLDLAGEPLYLHVAKQVAHAWNDNGNCGLVVGSTYPDEMKRARAAAPTLPFLIPGIGAQGGELQESIEAARTKEGTGFIIAVSRSIIYASSDADFAEAARSKAQEYDTAIREVLY